MNREDYQKAKEIFQTALGGAPPSRQAYLDEACAADENLRCGVETSFVFYSCIALAGGLFLLMRFRLNEWVDRPTAI